jgi:hypothetical protein
MKVPREITLTIRSQRGDLAAELRWRDGRTELIRSTELMKVDAERWIRLGLDEWIGEGDGAEPRTTPSHSPEFLPRLGDYLARQFTFRISCERLIVADAEEPCVVVYPSADAVVAGSFPAESSTRLRRVHWTHPPVSSMTGHLIVQPGLMG